MLMVRFAGMLTLVQHREWWRRVATQAVARYGPSGLGEKNLIGVVKPLTMVHPVMDVARLVERSLFRKLSLGQIQLSLITE